MRHLAWAAAVTAALSGCEEGAGPFAKTDAPAGSPITGDAVTTETLDGAAAEGAEAEAETATVVPRSGRTGPQDVEAPSVFQTTDSALWDGRPSLGGIWVAAPNVKDPERVIMRNAANGRSVEGALFRRERENPGPPLQISSDAAEALGLLAGQPAQITVTAIRRQEAPAEAPRRTAAATRKTARTAPAAEPEPAAAAEPAAEAAAPAATEAEAPATEATAAEATPDAAAAPQLSPREQRAAERKAAREARLAARAAAKAEREAARAARAAARNAAGAGGAAAGAPLSAIDPIAGAAAAIDRADAAAPAEAPAAPAAAAAGRNVVQVATFADEANATRAVATLTKAGLAAEVRKSTNAGETVYAVIARGAGTRAEFLAKVRGLGFKDAYVLSE